MIEIIYDPYRLQQPASGDIVLALEEDYEPCLNSIKDSVNHGKSLTVLVRNPGICGWLDHIGPKYGGVVRHIDPVQSLSVALKHSPLPEYLKKPETIIQFGLLEKAKALPPKLGENAENWGHRVLIGDIWSHPDISTDEDISELLAWFMGRENDMPFILNDLLNKRFHLWISNSDRASSLLSWLQPDPFLRTRYLIWENLLSTYPENHIPEWLQSNGIWGVLSQFTTRKRYVNCIPFSPDVQLPPAIANFVRAFLIETWEKRSPMDSLSYLSGRLDVEITFLLERLRLQLQQGESIQQVFHDKLTEVSNGHQKVTELSGMLLHKPPPGMLSEAASFDEVRRWIKDDYLPFYRHNSMLNHLDVTIDLVNSFEKWLIMKYTSLLVSGEGMAYRQIHTLKKRMVDIPILVVMVDGLDYLSFGDHLLPELILKGLYPETEPMPYLAFIPSETHISKPAILRGKMPSQIPDERPTADYYQCLIQEIFQVKASSVRCATDKDMTIEELVSEHAKIYLYLDNQLDREYIHAAYPPYVRQRKFADYCKKMADTIVHAVNAAYEYHGFYPLVCICSDHGYTELPEKIPVISMNTKSKSRSTNDVNSEWNPENVWKLSPEIFGLNKPMAIPFQYGCFGSKPRGASHGGCTPQEMAVPWMTFSKTKPVSLVPITVSIEGSVFRRRKENPVKVCISNPNLYAVKLLQLKIESMAIPDIFPITIGAQSVVKRDAQLDGSDISTGITSLTASASFSSSSDKMVSNSAITLNTLGSMSTEFDDDFDA